MMTKEGSTKIIILMTPGAGVLLLGHGHISHYSEYALYSTLSICDEVIAIALRVYKHVFLFHC